MTTMKATEAQVLSAEEAYEIAVEAYIYLYPLVLMELTRQQMTNCPPGERPGFGPANMFTHARTFPPADFKAVVRPNFDTLYSTAWLDLTGGPVIMSLPDTHGRYYLMPLLDMWTDVFAAPGKRTSGTQATDFAITPPGWSGALPHGVRRIVAPTPHVWIIGRIQTNGVQDYDAVHQVQDGCRLTPLAEWGAAPRPAAPVQIDPRVDTTTPPLEQVAALSATAFFTLAAKLMEQQPPHLTDWSTLARMERIGLTVGKPFNPPDLLPQVAQALERVPADVLRLMRAKVPTLAPVVNGWQMNTEMMGAYGNYYEKRAIVALLGLGANQPADAIYPLNVADGAGQPVNGDHDYVMHFSKGELPPVEAFWSLTMYDAEGFQVANQLNRFALGDRDPLVYNVDGSLDLYLQHDHPGRDKEANWLPAPRGPLGLTLRLYAPKPQALDGRWNPPAVTRVR